MYGFNQLPMHQVPFGTVYPPAGMVLPVPGGSMDQLQVQANAVDISRIRTGGSMDQFQIEAARAPQGLGLHLAKKPNGDLVVTSTKPGGSAADAGIRAGTVIISVDGQIVHGREPKEVRGFIVGPEGTDVTLEIQDSKSKQRRAVSCVRRAVPPQAPAVSKQAEVVAPPPPASRVREWLQRNDAPAAGAELQPEREFVEAESGASMESVSLQAGTGASSMVAANGHPWNARGVEAESMVERMIDEKVMQFKQELMGKISEDEALHKSKLQDQIFSLTQMISSAVADFNEIRTDVQKDLEHIQHLENRIASLTAQVDAFMNEGKDTHTADFAYM